MAAAAVVLSILSDRPVLILAPATLTWQWQDEIWDMLGVPSAVWSSIDKQWIDHKGFPLTQKGDRDQVARCPMRIGIVSTGLITNGDDEGERGMLARKSFGVLILDEGHKARATRRGESLEPDAYNELMKFMRRVAAASDSVIVGTATPIQLRAVELWDLVSMIAQEQDMCLGLARLLGRIRIPSNTSRAGVHGRPSPTHSGTPKEPFASAGRARRFSRIAKRPAHRSGGNQGASLREPACHFS